MLKPAVVNVTPSGKKASALKLGKSAVLAGFLALVSAAAALAQENVPATTSLTPATTVKPAGQEKKEAAKDNKENKKPAEKEKKPEKPTPIDPKNLTAEQIVDTAVIIYANNVAGNLALQQIRKTTTERGKMVINHADGSVENASYEKRVMRGASLDKEKIRLDQETPSTKYALIYNDNKVVGVFNETVFTPREDASKAFQNQIWHGIDALLRYKESGATLKLAGRETYLGVEYHILELTDKENRKTRYFVSTKSYRVAWLDYTEDGIKYVRRFYDYRYAQNTLVPYRSVLFANDKQVEETQILTVTYGQKVEDEAFQAGE